MSRKSSETDKSQELKSESPLSVKNIVAGIIVTVIGGVILAYIIQDARFAPDLPTSSPSLSSLEPTPIRTQSVISTAPPNSTQIANATTVIVNIDEGNTISIYDGSLFISLNLVQMSQLINATIGAPGCVNQEITEARVGYAVIYECDKKYDIRLGSIKRRDSFFSVTFSAEFYVTQLEK